MEISFEGTVFTREADGTCSKETIAAIKRKISGIKRRKVPNEAEIARLTAFIESVYTEPSATSLAIAESALAATVDHHPEPAVESTAEPEPTAVAAELFVSVKTSVEAAVDDDAPSPPSRPVVPPLILSVEVNYVARMIEFVHRCLGTQSPTYNTFPSAGAPMPSSLDAVLFKSKAFRRSDYTVTPKIDGERMFLAICGFMTHSGTINYLSALVSLRGIVYPVSVVAPHDYYKGTCLDGELDPKTNLFYPFDVVKIAGVDYRPMDYSVVLDAVQRVTSEVYWIRDAYGMGWGLKPFVGASQARTLEDYVRHHKCDGLIYTHEKRVYRPNGFSGILKWKMIPSIDLGVELTDDLGRAHVCPYEGRIGFAMLTSKRWMPYHHGSKIVLSAADRKTIFDRIAPAAPSGARYIFEFEVMGIDCKWHVYEPPRASDMYGESSEDDMNPEKAKTIIDSVSQIRLKLLRERRDKTAPNHALTIDSTLANCANPITWDDL
jgi:hypothetical protein